MILKTIYKNYKGAKKAGGTFKEQINNFISLSKVWLKIKFCHKSDQPFSEYFSNYKILTYNLNSFIYLIREIFIEKEYFIELKTNEPLIIDCGANIGISILYFKKIFPQAKIIAFEANPFAYDLLQKNIANNNLTKVDAYNFALTDQEGEISFFIGKDLGTMVGSTKKARGGDKEIKVSAKKLSSYLDNIDNIDVLKIDVEGAEWQIIRDLETTSCLKKVNNYLIEFHHHLANEPSKFSEFLKIFEDNGFCYSIKTAYNYKGAFQDIFLHCYKR